MHDLALSCPLEMDCRRLAQQIKDSTLQWQALLLKLPGPFILSILLMQVSGTTATVAAVVGWELLVANVGDSCAYLDTGSEVLQVSY